MNFPKKHNLLEIKNLAEQLLEAVEAYERELYERRDLHSPGPTTRLRALRATMDRLTDNAAEEDFEALCRKAFELFVCNPDLADISYLQRKLRIGYGKAAHIVDELEDRGYIAWSRRIGMPCKILRDHWDDATTSPKHVDNDEEGSDEVFNEDKPIEDKDDNFFEQYAEYSESLCRKSFELFLRNPKNASISFLLRMPPIGYGEAVQILDDLEVRGYIGASRGPNKPREILKSKWEG